MSFRPLKWLQFLFLLLLLHFTILYLFVSKRTWKPGQARGERVQIRLVKRRTTTVSRTFPPDHSYSLSTYHLATVSRHSQGKNTDRIYDHIQRQKPAKRRLRVLKQSDPDYRAFFKPRSKMVTPHQFHYVIKPDIRQWRAEPFLLILVFTKAENQEQRNAIRQTWATVENHTWWARSVADKPIRVYFLIGRASLGPRIDLKLKKEAEVFNDIIIQDFVDSYANLTLKALLALQWTVECCPRVRWMMKSDDDMFINVASLLTVLERFRDLDNVIYGFKFNGGRVMRGGRWKVPYKMYPFDYYPAYFAGGGYVISRRLVRLLHNVSYYFPVVSIEDAFITGILPAVLRHQVNVTRRHDERFAHWLTKRDREAMLCDVITESRLTMTNVRPNEMTSLWRELTFRDKDCLLDACQAVGRGPRSRLVQQC